jgi:hypothetical protein
MAVATSLPAEDRFLAFAARSQGDREGAPGIDLAGSARRVETTAICADLPPELT